MKRVRRYVGVLLLTLTILLNYNVVNQGEDAMIDNVQLKGLIVRVLKDMEPEVPYSDTAVNLLMLTAAVESNLGTYLEQVRGPAQGIFQMEPNTEYDIWKNYLTYKPQLKDKINGYRAEDTKLGSEELKWNFVYAIAMARIKYLRSSHPLPPNNKEALATYWKLVYNTPLGKGTVEKAVKKYTDMVEV
jgi:hypothetical protein